ncbi:MAG: hypothetical protein JRI68_09855 [Deltaproteobacteria bacterium]|nr:hypothetical protein [Deltaproteobacteria bacterium]
MKSRFAALLSAALVVGVCGVWSSGCMLTNINADECDSTAACVTAFGLGSSCSDGYCTDAGTCSTGHDCRRLYNGGACVEGRCVNELPADPVGACTLHEPADLAGKPLTGDGSPVIVGGMYRMDDSADGPMSQGGLLAIREINDVGRLNEGREIAMVVCDNGGTDNALLGDERQQRIQAVVDYLAGTLGVPYITGPVTSSDSLTTLNYMLAQGYPTVMISPSATSPQLTVEPDRLDPENDTYGLFWRTAPSDEFQGFILADRVVGQLPAVDPTLTHVAVVYIDDAYGLGLATVFSETWAGMSNTTDLFPFAEATDWPALATQVAAGTPDAVLMIAIEAERTINLVSAMAQIPALASQTLYLTDGSKDETWLLDPNLDAGVQTILFNQTIGTAPAAPSGTAFDVFAAAMQAEFSLDPRAFAFVANTYDAAYVGAFGVVYASQEGSNWDGRNVATGLARLHAGAGAPTVSIGKNEWANAKGGLTTADKEIEITGISGGLDFDAAIGEAPAPIEVWQPSANCGSGPCFAEIAVINL